VKKAVIMVSIAANKASERRRIPKVYPALLVSSALKNERLVLLDEPLSLLANSIQELGNQIMHLPLVSEVLDLSPNLLNNLSGKCRTTPGPEVIRSTTPARMRS
jgi:hypothetical protein